MFLAELVGIKKQLREVHVEELIQKLCLKEVKDDVAGILSDGYE